MPCVDEQTGNLVIRIVYDGSPYAGKTTSLRTLAESLGVEVITPAEVDGRTQFFDWVDYVGGLFEGRRIRCQVVSVPGQHELSARRRHLLGSADAVVLVADTRAEALPYALSILQGLTHYCRNQDPPVGIVLQANKRDAPDCVELEQLRAQAGKITPLAVVETVATHGDGVREAFVFAVRLALDRVRAYMESGRFEQAHSLASSSDELLRAMQSGPASTIPSSPAKANDSSVRVPKGLWPTDDDPHEPRAAASAESGSDDEFPFVPNPAIPGGSLWPPVDGRVTLHALAQQGVSPSRTAAGDWMATVGDVRVHSAANALYPNADAGRHALIEWAREHATHRAQLSADRTVVLADAGQGRCRLWQLVRHEHSIAERIEELFCHASAHELADALRQAVSQARSAHERWSDIDLMLPARLDTVSAEPDAEPRFVGLMPAPDSPAPTAPSAPRDIAQGVARLLELLDRQRNDAVHVGGRLLQGLKRDGREDVIVELRNYLEPSDDTLNAVRSASGDPAG